MNPANLLPTPQVVSLTETQVELTAYRLAPACGSVPAHLAERCARLLGGSTGTAPATLEVAPELGPEGCELTISADAISLRAGSNTGFDYGLDRIEQLTTAGRIRTGYIRDWPALERRGFQLNFGGLRHLTAGAASGLLHTMRQWRLNTVLLEYENRFPYQAHPQIAAADQLTTDEVAGLVATAAALGIEVIPLQQCLGHVDYILRHDSYAGLREEEVERDQWCPLHPGSLDLFRTLADDMAAQHPGRRYLHLGGDETRRLGTCPRCAAFVADRGKGALYLKFVQQAVAHAMDLGLTPILWDDMVCHYPEILDELPREVVIMYWEYWTTRDPSAVFVARPDGRGVVVDHHWHGPAAGELDSVERRMIADFTEAIDLAQDLSPAFRQRFAPYLGPVFPRRVRAFPYLEYYRDHGFRVIGCGAGGSNYSLWHGLPDFPRYLDNIATWSQRAAEAGVLGVVTSAWYDFPVEALIPGIVCTGQTAWNPSGVSAAVR